MCLLEEEQGEENGGVGRVVSDGLKVPKSESL